MTGSWPAAILALSVLSGTATATAATTAYRCRGARRRGWAGLAAGTGGWTLGAWWYAGASLASGHPVRLGNPGDLGLLAFPVFVALGLLLRRPAWLWRRSQRLRVCVDTATVALAVLVIVWHLPLAYGSDWGTAPAALAVRVGYLLGVLALAVVVITMASNPGDREYRPRGAARTWWLYLGVLALSGTYPLGLYSGGVADRFSATGAALVCAFGFGSITVAGAYRSDRPARPRPRAGTAAETLPYLLIAGAVLAMVGYRLDGRPLGAAGAVQLGGLALLMVGRVYLVSRENHGLVAQVRHGNEELARAERYDPVTGLPNLAGFVGLIEQAVAGGQPICVLRLGLTVGQAWHSFAAEEEQSVVFELAARLRGCLSPGDRLARVGEYSFGVLMAGRVPEARRLAGRLLLAAQEPVDAIGGGSRLHLAAGIAAMAPDAPGASPAALPHHAFIAWATVAAIPDGVSVFTAEMQRRHASDRSLLSEIERGVIRDAAAAIQVRYEPVAELAGGTLAGMAANPVWQGDGRVVEGGRLMQLARQCGLARRVDEVVLSTAISDFASWQRCWPGACPRVWVPVCAESLADAELPVRLRHLLEAAEVPASALVLAPRDDLREHPQGRAAQGILSRLRALGVRVAAGDALEVSGSPAGAGDTDRLATVHYFDIPPALVERCLDDLRAARLIQTTVEFATGRRAGTCASEVTTVEQHEQLRELGCTLGRGPFYGGAEPATRTARLIETAAAGTWHAPIATATRRRRSRRAWQELRQVINGVPIAAFACDADGRLILAEGALLRQLGLAPDILGQPITALARGLNRGESEAHGPGTTVELRNALRVALAGRSAVATVRVRQRYLQVHLCPNQDDSAGGGALGVAIDITNRVQAAQALRNSEERFRAIFTKAPVGMIIVGADSLVREVNPAMAELLGYPVEELVGRALPSLWHPDTPPDSESAFHSIVSGRRGGLRAERAYRHRDGSPVWARVTVWPLSGGGAPVGAALGMIEDLRALKQLEVQLRHAQKLEAVGMLAAGIAHEINTPIQFIGDNLSFLAQSFSQLSELLVGASGALVGPAADPPAGTDLPWLLEEVPSAIDQSLEGVNRVATIVRAMRNFGHPDERDPVPVDINAAIRDTTTVARNEYKYVADLELRLGDVPPVLGYPSEFNQVVLNLVVNAAHAIADVLGRATGRTRGTIGVRTWADHAMAHVAVSDDGCGMPAEIRERVFEPFFTTKPVGKGTGQGLAIAYSVVVEKHGGTIEVASEPGGGSTFTLHLPLQSAVEAGRTGGPAGEPGSLAAPALPAPGGRPPG